MKALLLIALLAAPCFGQTTAELEAQIAVLQAQADSTRADSTALLVDLLVQADSTMEVNGISALNAPHPNGNYDQQWVGLDFPLSSATELQATKITFAIAILKAQFKAQDSGVSGRVRIRKDRVPAAIESIKEIF